MEAKRLSNCFENESFSAMTLRNSYFMCEKQLLRKKITLTFPQSPESYKENASQECQIAKPIFGVL